jgi:hypothetical protein
LLLSVIIAVPILLQIFRPEINGSSNSAGGGIGLVYCA